jgi:hypothetical protein
MYGHVGEQKLLVPSFGREVLAIVNSCAEKLKVPLLPKPTAKKKKKEPTLGASSTIESIRNCAIHQPLTHTCHWDPIGRLHILKFTVDSINRLWLKVKGPSRQCPTLIL